jgi:undecaprenyl-diphosphatase
MNASSNAAGSVFGRDVQHWTSRSGQRLARTHKRIADRIGLHGASAAGLIVGGVTVAVTTALAITVYDNVTGKDGIARVDQPALRIGKRFRGPGTDFAAGAIAEVFGPIGMPLLTLAAGVGLAVHRRSREPFELVAAAGTGSLLMTLLGKRLIHRNRPPHRDAAPPYEHSPSFPSGHTINATTILGTLAYLLMVNAKERRSEPVVAAVAGGTALAVGASRILLGAHWLTDVLMGWTTGAGWLATIVTVHRLTATNGQTPRGQS